MRRTFLKTIPAALCATVAGPGLLSSRFAHANEAANNWPSRPIRIIVPAAPGAGPDTTSRIIAQAVSERIGQPIIIENKPGGSGTVAASLALQAPGDGYTFIYCIPSTQMIPPPSIRYDPEKDIVPVSLAVAASFILVVDPKLPYNTVQELIDAAKAKPESINFGSSGVGTFGHMLAAQFELASNAKLMHIPFTSEPPVTNAIIGGELQMAFISTGVSLPLIKSGKLRPLAVSSEKRMNGVPENIPPLAETLPGYNMVTYNYFAAKAGTPQSIVDRMSEAITATLNDPPVRERFYARGMAPLGGTPQELQKVIDSERVKLTTLIKQANIG